MTRLGPPVACRLSGTTVLFRLQSAQLADARASPSLVRVGPGGSASSGPYAIHGAIGQLAAGPRMTGGNYVLTGGFFGMISVVGPPLKIMRNPGGTITILWPSHFTAHTLEQSPDLTPGSWTASAYPVTDNGVIRSITLTPPPARLFFRLMP